MEIHPLIKLTHIGCVLLTFASFSTRAYWMVNTSPMLSRRWVRILPHLIDTALLLSGIALMLAIQQYPVVDNWLSAKLVGLILYIGLGTVALKRGKTLPTRIAALIGAYASFFYIIAVALTRNPLPFVT